ncbi:MAG: thiamine phosphate synthase [Hyphomicrobiaceae bacterium]|nr:thiamine phosphate synthase [Hyphomicrobiaceae bacterium]
MPVTAVEPTQLMLALEVGDGAADRLAAILAVAPVASVVLRPLPGRPLVASACLPLVEAGQKTGVAMLLEADAELARTLRADGVHLPVSDDPLPPTAAARAWLGGRAIVGADAGWSRHDAMSLGEAGVDYVAFGIPPFVKERAEAVERRLDLVAWWAEIFEVPVVAMNVTDAGEAGPLALAGADFVCLSINAGIKVADAAELARAVVSAMASAKGRVLSPHSS